MRSEINKRLLAAASLVREGAVLADVGTDHACLPIYLLRTGRISRAVLSDINEGPLSAAADNAAEGGVSDSVRLVLTDGAAALADLGITDYAICGMGGELIARIISDAPQLKNPTVNLIMQPMTRPEALRAMLYEGGFEIKRELYCEDEGRYYLTLLASYSGKRTEYTLPELYFGKAELRESLSADGLSYMKLQRARLKKIRNGKNRGNESSKTEELLLSEIEKIIKSGEA